jgi:hypothetical protein
LLSVGGGLLLANEAKNSNGDVNMWGPAKDKFTGLLGQKFTQPTFSTSFKDPTFSTSIAQAPTFGTPLPGTPEYNKMIAGMRSGLFPTA